MVREIMQLSGKILTIACVAIFGGAHPALAQSGNNYGLSNIGPYDVPVAPPANGLARVIRSEKPNPTNMPSKFRPDTPAFTIAIHGYGEVIVDSTSRR